MHLIKKMKWVSSYTRRTSTKEERDVGGWVIGYRSIMVEGSLDRRRSLELTRSGEGYWYRQASTIHHQCLSRFQIESGATFAKSPCKRRSTYCVGFISWWHCHLRKQILLDINRECTNCISCIKQGIIQISI